MTYNELKKAYNEGRGNCWHEIREKDKVLKCGMAYDEEMKEPVQIETTIEKSEYLKLNQYCIDRGENIFDYIEDTLREAIRNL